MTRWHRLSYPPRFWGWTFVCLLISCNTLAVTLRLTVGHMLADNHMKRVDLGVGLMCIPLCGVAGLVCGLFRAWRCPLLDPGMRQWIVTSPWNGLDRTPFGPCRLHWYDLVPLGMLGLIGLSHVIAYEGFGQLPSTLSSHMAFQLFLGLLVVLVPTFAFLVAWMMSMTPVLVRWRSGVGILLGWWGVACLSIGVLAGIEWTMAAVIASIPILAALYSLWLTRALREFPETSIRSEPAPDLTSRLSPEMQCLSPAGYVPKTVLALHTNRTITTHCCLMLGVVTAWIPWDSKAMSGLLMLLIVPALTRVLIVSGRLQSPLSLSARWATGRWIVPAWDLILLPSIGMMVSAGMLLMAGAIAQIPVRVIVPLAITCSSLIGTLSGRNSRHWSLTAPASYDTSGRNRVQ